MQQLLMAPCHLLPPPPRPQMPGQDHHVQALARPRAIAQTGLPSALQSAAIHYEVWKHYQNTGEARAQVLQNVSVQQLHRQQAWTSCCTQWASWKPLFCHAAMADVHPVAS